MTSSNWWRIKASGLCWRWRIYFELRDIWVGVYWKRGPVGEWDIYICLLPCLPIRIFQCVGIR